MVALIVVVVLVIVLTMIFSFVEAVLYSTPRAELDAAISEDRQTKAARLFLSLKKNIAAPLAAMLILSTVVTTVGASTAGALAIELFGPKRLIWFSFAFTLIILVFSEIIPKTVGAIYWRSLWPYVGHPLQLMIWILYPGVQFCLWLSRIITGGNQAVLVTEEEILAMVRLGVHSKEISDMESLMVHNIIGLEDKDVGRIMTPRTVIFGLDISMTVQSAYEAACNSGFSRIPVFAGSPENINGYVMMKDLSSRDAWEHPTTPIKRLVKPVTFVPEHTNCLILLRRFLEKRQHMAIVVDEYGGLEGLVTLEDLLETIIGQEIVDETDRTVDMQALARKKKRAIISNS
ncbi:MAG: HlyC/CorC family transporter [Deltaproteobacteria bacterium]|nr:HlyC/CorC family transporter [Deltaproteobacteria bacterium]